MIGLDELWNLAEERWSGIDRLTTRLIFTESLQIRYMGSEIEIIDLVPVDGDFVMGYGPLSNLLAVRRTGDNE